MFIAPALRLGPYYGLRQLEVVLLLKPTIESVKQLDN